MNTKLDSFTLAYIEAMLFSTTDNRREDGGDPLDENYSIADIEAESLARIVADCAEFQRMCDEYYDDSEDAGRDFWFTRCGHGVGFWDGDYEEPFASLLTFASKTFGNIDPYVSDSDEVCL